MTANDSPLEHAIKQPIDAVRDGLPDYGWKLLLGEVELEQPEKPGFLSNLDRYSYVRVSIDGEEILIEADHFSVRLPAKITAAIASIVLRTLEAGPEKLPAMYDALAWETRLLPDPAAQPKKAKRPKKGGASPGQPEEGDEISEEAS